MDNRKRTCICIQFVSFGCQFVAKFVREIVARYYQSRRISWVTYSQQFLSWQFLQMGALYNNMLKTVLLCYRKTGHMYMVKLQKLKKLSMLVGKTKKNLLQCEMHSIFCTFTLVYWKHLQTCFKALAQAFDVLLLAHIALAQRNKTEALCLCPNLFHFLRAWEVLTLLTFFSILQFL